MENLPFSCRCGEVRGTLLGLPNGNHARCFCQSCRLAALYTGASDPSTIGITVWQTTPDHISFTQGQTNLSLFSLSEKGLLRWRASCCGTALINTLRRARFPFAALQCDTLPDTTLLGRIGSEGFIPRPNGTTYHKGLPAMIGGTLWRATKARLSGRWKNTPFFDRITGAPTRPIKILSRAVQNAILPAPLHFSN